MKEKIRRQLQLEKNTAKFYLADAKSPKLILHRFNDFIISLSLWQRLGLFTICMLALFGTFAAMWEIPSFLIMALVVSGIVAGEQGIRCLIWRHYEKN